MCWRCKLALLEALLEPWRSFEELWRSFEDLEAIWSLEVQVFTSGGFLEALLEPWRSFEELWRSSEALEAISSLEVHKCWIGALWRYFEALDVHVSTFQHCKSSFELVECILSV